MTPSNPYDRLAPIYESLETLYSGGAIRRCKLEHLAHVYAGDRVVYVGVGAGEDARDALRLGAAVTAIDRSAGMLRRTERRLKRIGQGNWRVILGDFMDYRGSTFDLVVAHFFLNLFNARDLPCIIDELARLVTPGGKLQVADFAPFANGIAGLVQRAYWYFPLGASALLTGHPIHPIYDYSALLEGAGMRILEKRTFPVFRVGPRWFYCLTTEKPPG